MRLFYRMVNLKLSANLLLCSKRKKLSAKNTDKRKSKAQGIKQPTDSRSQIFFQTWVLEIALHF
jgi:hypothetical protein